MTSSGETAACTIQVTAIYDTAHAGKKIRGIVNRMKGRFAREITFRLHLWRSDLFVLAAARELARNDAELSGLLAVALETPMESGGPVESFIRNWIVTHRESNAAMVVLNLGGKTLDPMLESLRLTAMENRVDFICSESPGGVQKKIANQPPKEDPKTGSQPTARSPGKFVKVPM